MTILSSTKPIIHDMLSSTKWYGIIRQLKNLSKTLVNQSSPTILSVSIHYPTQKYQ